MITMHENSHDPVLSLLESPNNMIEFPNGGKAIVYYQKKEINPKVQ